MSIRTLSTACRSFRQGLLVILLCCASGSAFSAQCWTGPGKQYGIDPLLLLSIAQVESSMNPNAVNKNKNGTIDIGLMQINSSNFPMLAQAGFDRKKITDSCTSIQVAAVVLSGFIKRHGYTWTAIGAYNAGSAPSRAGARKRYATKVWQIYRKVLRDRQEQEKLLAQWRRHR